MHYIIFLDHEEASIIDAFDDPIEAIQSARQTAKTYVTSFYNDMCIDVPESDRPEPPGLKETFVTRDRGEYYFSIDADTAWSWTVQKFEK